VCVLVCVCVRVCVVCEFIMCVCVRAHNIVGKDYSGKYSVLNEGRLP